MGSLAGFLVLICSVLIFMPNFNPFLLQIKVVIFLGCELPGL